MPELAQSLLSVSKLDERRAKMITFNGEAAIMKDNEEVMKARKMENNMWIANVKAAIPMSARIVKESAIKQKVTIMLLHQKLGHVNFKYIKKLGIPYVDDQSLCEVCQIGKSSVGPFLRVKEKERNIGPGEGIHTDYCGPMHIRGINGELGFWTYIDEATGRVIVFMKEGKTNQLDCLRQVVNLMETQTGNKVKKIKSDNSTEYQSSQLEKFIKERGISVEPSNPYTPQQNGRAERMNRTLVEMARCMIKTANLNIGPML